jgi:hypothetical protein
MHQACETQAPHADPLPPAVGQVQVPLVVLIGPAEPPYVRVGGSLRQPGQQGQTMVWLNDLMLVGQTEIRGAGGFQHPTDICMTASASTTCS